MLGRGLYIARTPLGKYIILGASILHYYWAVLLLISPQAGKATPVAILVYTCGGSIAITIGILIAVATLAMLFLFVRGTKYVSTSMFAALLLPQLVLLFLSAERGVVAAWQQHYADGTHMIWSHILVDQSAILVIALVYLTAIIEVSRSKFDVKTAIEK